ncbi:hypothetical protein [Mesorhizobium sp. ANAO-SY3R2]|uniref:hypothetical protein n=1 Tax=Mesorhizobium sp. ANAO-SY3R2 TaxID=3166644 RepID=UPI00366C39F2
MTYRTCVGCVHGTGYCHERERVREQVAGLGVTSLKWRCGWKRPQFRPGDPVWATTLFDIAAASDYDDEGPVQQEYPATVIQNFGSKLLVFIKPGVFEYGLEDGDYPFSPKNSGTGFCKITLQRIRKRDGVRENVCHYCRQITRLQGHDDYCPSVPNINWSRCLPARSAEV